MPAPTKKKKREETRSNEEIALLSAMNSEYNIMQPMANAEYIRVRNPLTGKDPSFKTNEDSFRELIQYLCEKGLTKKLEREFDEFALKHNPKWAMVKEYAMTVKIGMDETNG